MTGFYTTFNIYELNAANGVFTVNTTLVDFGNVSINTTAFFINTTTVGLKLADNNLLVGNSTVNATLNSLCLALANTTLTANYGVERMHIANSTTNVQINSSVLAISNSTGQFFIANASSIRVGQAGNLANLTPTRLELGSGTTFISPAGLQIGGGATMNTTHADVNTLVASTITANFAGVARQLDSFGTSKRGVINAASGDANTVLQSDNQWVQQGVYWYAADSNSIYNDANVDILWTGVTYTKVEIIGWMRQNTDQGRGAFRLSHDGSSFSGYNGACHQKEIYTNHIEDDEIARTNVDDFRLNTILTVGNNDAEGTFFNIEIHNHQGGFTTVQTSTGWRWFDNNDMQMAKSWGCISNATAPQGIRLLFSTGGNIRNYKYVVKVYP